MTATITEITVEDLRGLVGDLDIPCTMPNFKDFSTHCEFPAHWKAVLGALSCGCPGQTLEICDDHKEQLLADKHWHCPQNHCLNGALPIKSLDPLR